MTESNLIEHANRELDLLKFPKPTRAQLRGDLSANGSGSDERWDLMIRISVIKIVEMFAKQGHSGGSAQQVMRILHQLLQYKPLSPITDNPEDWTKVDLQITSGLDMWQCRRNSEAMSHNGGKTYYFVNDYSRIGKLARKLPRGQFKAWVWSHRNWVHHMHKSVAHAA